MALTVLQRDVCRLLADGRRRSGESYVAGGAALGLALDTARLSRDLDIFHDTIDAVARSWEADRVMLTEHGYAVDALRERPGYVEATIARGTERLVIEWARDSAFRFFPLVEHEELGLTLHSFDLATNKVLALVGRLEPRDFVDVIACDARIQPLGYLAWAACGKDPGFSPQSIIEEARRSRYTDEELSALAFAGPAPRAADLARQWRQILSAATAIVDMLPAARVGTAVFGSDRQPFTGGAADLADALESDQLIFHAGRIGGALPTVKS
jgi:hypothetical protein